MFRKISILLLIVVSAITLSQATFAENDFPEKPAYITGSDIPMELLSDSESESTFNENGLIIQDVLYKGTPYEVRFDYTYDEKGNILTCEHRVHGVLLEITSYEYDSDGKEIRKTDTILWKDKNPSVIWNTHYEYDNDGNVIHKETDCEVDPDYSAAYAETFPMTMPEASYEAEVDYKYENGTLVEETVSLAPSWAWKDDPSSYPLEGFNFYETYTIRHDGK